MTAPVPTLGQPGRVTLLLLTALAPALWGTTYIVTTQALSEFGPWTMAMLRALLAGLILLTIVRALPPRARLGRLLVVAACNFSVFWVLLLVAAQRLPGGVAAWRPDMLCVVGIQGCDREQQRVAQLGVVAQQNLGVEVERLNRTGLTRHFRAGWTVAFRTLPERRRRTCCDGAWSCRTSRCR
jgi:hypothetical protein